MATAKPLVWDVVLKRQLRHGDSRFMLDLRLASTAQRVVLHGPSGAGKSQALRLIAGISRPDAGRVCLGGRVLTDTATGTALSPQARGLGCVFQDYALFPHLSVRQNIGFALHSGWRNPGQRDRHPAVDRWLGTFGLQDVADQLPHQLSGGQRQRTALARALVNQPKALLLDEPFAALDRPLRQRLRQELCALQAELQLPMLLITHDEDDVRALADDVVHIEAGQVVTMPSAPSAASYRSGWHGTQAQ